MKKFAKGVSLALAALCTIWAAALLFRTEKAGQISQVTYSPPLQTRSVSATTSNQPARFLPGSRSSLDEVGPNRRVHESTAGMQAEVSLASSPIGDDTLLVGWIDGPNGVFDDQTVVKFYRSLDGGESWDEAFIADQPDSGEVDPVTAFDRTGRMYISYLTVAPTGYRLYTRTSEDNGDTWSQARGVTGPATRTDDKPYAVCDISSESQYLNSYYLFFIRYLGAESFLNLTYSRDGGVTFSNPLSISDVPVPNFPYPAVGPEGELYVVFVSQLNGGIFFNRSLNGGTSWGDNTYVGTLEFSAPSSCPEFPGPTVYPVIACDISESPSRGRIYVAWPRFTAGNVDIVCVRSSDGGSTWSNPVVVSDDTTGNLKGLPWLSTNLRTGQLGLSWHDQRDDNLGCVFGIYASTSEDGGVTWSENVLLSDTLSEPTQVTTFTGHYNGGAPRDTGFYAAWCDLRHDLTGDCYMTWYGDSAATDAITTPPNELAASITLIRNYPNPFNATTQIEFELLVTSAVKLNIFDINGRQVTTLVDEIVTAGAHTISFDGSSFASGIYFARLSAGNITTTHKMVLLK